MKRDSVNIWNIGSRACICLTGLALGSTALAQAAAPPTGGASYLQTAPLYNFGTNPYGQSAAPAPSVPPGDISLVPPPAFSAQAVENYAKNVHGYVSAGVSSRGGDELSAGVDLPLLPEGKADLALSGRTGQTGSFPHRSGTKSNAPYKGYDVTLHVHPTDNLDAFVSFSQTDYRSAYPYYR